jgi:hypothetical protein
MSWEEIKRELGQQFDTVRRWCVDTGEKKALVPVRVVQTRAPSRSLSVVSPTGFRIDGQEAEHRTHQHQVVIDRARSQVLR